MKTATKRPNLPNDNLWQWAEQSRRARYLPAPQASRLSCRTAQEMAQGILNRLVELFRASVTR